jgi:hypothetical protein
MAPNINLICENDTQRISLLSNIIKRIPTTNNSINNKIELFDNKTQGFKSIRNINDTYKTKFNVILDTGNSSYTSIGINIAHSLGLESRRITTTYLSGVVKDATTYNNKVTSIQLRFIDESYSLNNTYTINGYISNDLPNTLLIGQCELNGLKQLFDDNYCISYNQERQYNLKHTSEYSRETNRIINEICSIVDSLNINIFPKIINHLWKNK